MTKIGKNEYVALEVIEKICQTLDCDIADVVSCLPTTDSASNRSGE